MWSIESDQSACTTSLRSNKGYLKCLAGDNRLINPKTEIPACDLFSWAESGSSLQSQKIEYIIYKHMLVANRNPSIKIKDHPAEYKSCGARNAFHLCSAEFHNFGNLDAYMKVAHSDSDYWSNSSENEDISAALAVRNPAKSLSRKASAAFLEIN